ncbi:hypothetical protein KO525_07050 [Psychrosphaera sp. B3R10]|uniref:SGNH/GDSL hydrolase family protein n=1 Tax=unclassified Psychrosphaera TaxID=2641570 RepID=UPI001C09572F|nr:MULTISPECIES: GDSL-type esterase/lipase family protein [unclassified Psychrosphaera]MBU2880548.1 hypothetical protein [Psychrosphaera sp. I2R16]MBU2989131.1 hypothetical protein [Psychrosphaera sp. B3R10]MDO6717788.1 SGNH/GDSL hydrolase family protein [Psychrosphaera sp. 1_MG-2023]
MTIQSKLVIAKVAKIKSTRLKSTLKRLLTACLVTLTLTSCVTTENKSGIVKANNDKITVMGRTITTLDGAVQFSYPGVTFVMNVKAKGFTANLSSTNGTNYIDISIDGGEPKSFKISQQRQNITLFMSQNIEQHNVVIQHRSESWHGTTTLHNLTLNDGQLLDAPTLPNKKILFIGDSITCGDAIDRPIPLAKEQCKKTNAWWNAKQTFGMLLSEKFDAQAHLVCFGGKGVVRTWQGKTNELNAEDFYLLSAPDNKDKSRLLATSFRNQTNLDVNKKASDQHKSDIYNNDNQIEKRLWPQQNYHPDLAVVVLGTNDFSSAAGAFPEQEHFVKSYRRLIYKIRNDHPGVKIAISDGPMLSGEAKRTLRMYLTEIVEHYKSDEVSLLLAEHNPGDSCDYHPNKDIHKVIANDFYQPLKQLMHW